MTPLAKYVFGSANIFINILIETGIYLIFNNIKQFRHKKVHPLLVNETNAVHKVCLIIVYYLKRVD